MVKKVERVPRDTTCYTLYDFLGNPVYHGITNNLDRRLSEHSRSGKCFSHVTSSVKRTRPRAEKDETRKIHEYQDKNLFGNPPRYNKAKTKKNGFGWGVI
jgi:hypothetical protein